MRTRLNIFKIFSKWMKHPSLSACRYLKSIRIWSYSGPHFPAFGLRTSPYSVRTRENTDQNNSEYGRFSLNVCIKVHQFFSEPASSKILIKLFNLTRKELHELDDP